MVSPESPLSRVIAVIGKPQNLYRGLARKTWINKPIPGDELCKRFGILVKGRGEGWAVQRAYRLNRIARHPTRLQDGESLLEELSHGRRGR